MMKETVLQYTTFGYVNRQHIDVITVVMVPFALEIAAEVLDEAIEHYEINIEDGALEDGLIEVATLKCAQYKLMRGHKFGHAPSFTRAELVVMDDALTQWIEMNEEEPSNEGYYACIALNKITKALQHME